MAGFVTEPCCSDIRHEHGITSQANKVRIFMNSRGCRYAKRKECTHCGFFCQAMDSISEEDIYHSFKHEFEKYDYREHPVLAILTPGSFLDDCEVMPKVRERIFSDIRASEDIHTVIIETRPEFITDEKIRGVIGSLGGKKVIVAMGLDSANDFIRNKCLNKSFKWSDYVRAAKIIKKYCELRSYVLFKPPFITENEAIDDAISSIEASFSLGSESVFLEICNVPPGSPLEALYDLGFYKPARLWSVVEVLERFEGMRVFVGSLNDYPRARVEASGCDLCSDKVKEELNRYNSSLDLSRLREIECGCRYAEPQDIRSQRVPLLLEQLAPVH